MIAVQVGAFKLDESNVVLHGVTVLDVTGETPEAHSSEEAERTDRKYWEKKRDFASLAVMDKIATALKAAGLEERLSSNKHHVALGSTVSVAPRPFRLSVRDLGSTVRRVIFCKGAHNGRP
ncbi:hypothetical protein, partial [Bradyrhizobium sp. 151]|uniref:hypothetical protein n=1 Tax=Bradyrhizobium sp. 151 TaxID=2782626 RepID=UPI001FF9188F